MRNSWFAFGAIGGCLALGCLAWSGAASAAENAGAAGDAAKLVRQALEAELAGDNRTELLTQALAIDPDNKQARWQLGFVRIDNQWVKIDDVPKVAASDELLKSYRAKRDGLVETADAHRELARWCRKSKLAGEAQLHWAKLLEFEPQDAEALSALGLKWHEGRLLTQSQINAQRAEAADRMAAMKRYRPQAMKWRTAIAGENQQKATEAIVELAKLEDPDSLVALESVFADNMTNKANDRANRALIQTAARMKHPEATAVLVRRALNTDSEEVRLAACDALKQRPMYSYVPQLLAEMPGKTDTKFSITLLPNGTVLHEHAVTYRDRTGPQTVNYESSVTPASGVVALVAPQALANETQKAAAIEGRARVVEAANNARRARVEFALHHTTGMNDPEDPQLWNKQYAEYYGWGKPAEKAERETRIWQHATFFPIPATEREGQEQRKPVAAVAPQRRLSNLRQVAPSHYACFPAGTPVLTLAGPRPIEGIKAGDRVLSQNPSTGELSYQPVFARTLRQSAKLLRVQLGDCTIAATYGHPFWVVGQGWQVAGHLKPGMRLRGVENDAKVDHVEPIADAEVYNLLVSDNATYFVGDSRLLVHDDSPLENDGDTVPGLAAR